ncbi:MAG: hemerythrin domain-containing protein [Pseudomonadota bacterium]
MDASIRMLYAEHRVIQRIVGALGCLSALAAEGVRPPLDAVGETMDLMRECTDAYHHGKEERILFPMLEEQGRFRLRAPVAVLTREHETGREYVGRMAQAHAARLQGEWREVFTRHAFSYQELLRAHITKEDRGLFPTADKALDAAQKEDLARMFASFEETAPARLDEYRRRVVELEQAIKDLRPK